HTDVLLKARQACYKARDAFYSCLEKQSDKKPTEIGSVGLLYPTECKGSREEFVKHCRASWVKHFDRQYCMTKRTQRLLDDRETRRDYGAVAFTGLLEQMDGLKYCLTCF
ncbi:Cytochrome c oxidase isoform 2, partial [Theobroma cacao]